jgi:hypothetical protein
MSFGFNNRLTAANLRVFLAFPWIPRKNCSRPPGETSHDNGTDHGRMYFRGSLEKTFENGKKTERITWTTSWSQATDRSAPNTEIRTSITVTRVDDICRFLVGQNSEDSVWNIST